MSQSMTEAAVTAVTPLSRRWYRLSLLSQFVMMGAVVLLVGMLLIGIWVGEQIEKGVVNNSAASTALFMRSFIEPVVQELGEQDSLNPASIEQLSELLNRAELSNRVVSFKIWKEGGLVTYSSRREVIGRRFPETENLRKAWAGVVTAEFDALEDEEDALERASGITLLEMYSPIRESRTGRIIAVAEFYETAETLRNDLFWSELTSWLVVGAVTLLMFGALYGIVLRGHRTILSQRRALERQVTDLSRVLKLNEELHQRVQRASQRTVEINERYLRRISADLHDGPAQLMSFALLRIDSLRRQLPAEIGASGQEDIDMLGSSLAEALEDVRAICAGLTLPELDTLSPRDLVKRVASAHERRTNTRVEVSFDGAPERLGLPFKIGVYRFIQETLSNAFRYAEGKEQRVHMCWKDELLEVEVSDRGPGFSPDMRPESGHGLGLPGLQERIESLGGDMRIYSRIDSGTRVVMRCDLSTREGGVHRESDSSGTGR
ncbi:sensor histidine kinase [Aestuariirhabdus litorea]|uniref:Oxygen sensor histidine kinase NreB n=1 Tax=Aestuariirhabdus litorea TaxID=2528527 RepID=A0A3P3VKR1_9GAMM|nr:sensor histidine kinase [Aestuariirhabdus litorea]RRJ83322.1 sensor histidine kinase [Aestuariirhabdus litorea]RWW93482.1 sensor histidine kinase [Endozoicomonadaceae bacterium GTF-13]